MVIQLSHTHRAEDSYALSASFRNLFLKTPKYHAEQRYRKSFVFQQDRQNLVGRWRHSRLGPALFAFHSLNDLILLLHDELQNICRNPSSAKMLLHQKIQNDVQWSGGSYSSLRTWRSRMSFTKASWAWKQFLTQPFFPQNFHISSSSSRPELKG